MQRLGVVVKARFDGVVEGFERHEIDGLSASDRGWILRNRRMEMQKQRAERAGWPLLVDRGGAGRRERKRKTRPSGPRCVVGCWSVSIGIVTHSAPWIFFGSFHTQVLSVLVAL